MESKKGPKLYISLDYLIGLVEMLLKNRSNISRSAQMSMFFSIFYAVRESLSKTLEMRNELQKTICDEYRLKYDEYYRKISNSYTNLNDEFKILENYSQGDNYKYLTSDEVQSQETKKYDFVNCDKFDIKSISSSLWEKHLTIQNVILDGLKKIKGYIEEVKNDVEAFEADWETFEEQYEGSFEFLPAEGLKTFNMLNERMSCMFSDYCNKMWRDDRDVFKKKVRAEISAINSCKEAYQAYLNKMEIDAGSLQNLYLKDPKRLPIAIYRNREFYTQSDINDLFAFMCSYQLLRSRIISFDYLVEPDKKYDKIFKNKACQIFAEVIGKIILKVIPYDKEYSLSALFMAFHDFGICKGITARKQMAIFLTENNPKKQYNEYKEDNLKKIASLLGKSYGILTSKDYVSTNLNEQEYNTLKPVYWGCFTILNYIFELDVAAEGFSSYLEEIDNVTWSLLTNDDIEELNKLRMLKSVITGEATDF